MTSDDDGFLCACRITFGRDGEGLADDLHVWPCCDDHRRTWADRLPAMLAEMGLSIPVLTVEDAPDAPDAPDDPV